MADGKLPDTKQNARNEYADIIDLPHWEPNSRHPRMSLHARAAQFAPFAALVGYDEMIDEETRLTDRQIESGEEELDKLNRKLNRINGIIAGGTRPEVTITYFEPDSKKAGGRYATVTTQVRRIDTAARKVILITRDRPDLPETILFDRILDIRGNQVGEWDDEN